MLGAPYEAALTCLERGARMRSAADLERAEQTFKATGARLDLARTRQVVVDLKATKSEVESKRPRRELR